MSTDIAAGRRLRNRVRGLLLAIALGLVSAVSGVPSDVAAAGAVRTDMNSAEGPDGVAPGYPWRWPVDGRHVIIVPFRAPAHDYGPGHRGMDAAAEPGADVHAPAGGVIAFRGTVVDRPLITIDHGGGYVTTLEPVASDLSPGDAVTAGALVGVVAGGGHAPIGTLHVGVRVDDVYVNPRGLFGRPPRAILLPCCES
ncbi:murein hydrolase activator EnvC family protein [Microbacterium sp. MAHUQ-60]|uniref:murein hydrolase activator EnvC family protein n=1 Tax=unclassified Microbacterium TaxID=2609290 RepID=UPI003615DB90